MILDYYNVPDGKLTQKHLRDTSEYIPTAELLDNVGMELGVKTHQLDAIKTDNPNDIRQASFKMLLKWRENVTSDKEAWKTLIRALNRWLPGDQMQELYTALIVSN